MTGGPGGIKLAYGEWLRRRCRQVESRVPLRAARDAFDALGMTSRAERARQELRAAGETSRRRQRDSLDELTPQELQIVQMVAQGLSKRRHRPAALPLPAYGRVAPLPGVSQTQRELARSWPAC
jgi:hypothetical protein